MKRAIRGRTNERSVAVELVRTHTHTTINWLRPTSCPTVTRPAPIRVPVTLPQGPPIVHSLVVDCQLTVVQPPCNDPTYCVMRLVASPSGRSSKWTIDLICFRSGIDLRAPLSSGSRTSRKLGANIRRRGEVNNAVCTVRNASTCHQ